MSAVHPASSQPGTRPTASIGRRTSTGASSAGSRPSLPKERQQPGVAVPQRSGQVHQPSPRSHRDTPAQFVADQTALLDQSRSQQGHHRPQLSQRPVGFPTVVQVLKEQPDLLHHQVGALQQCPAGRRRLPTAVSGTLAPTGLLTRRLRVVTLVGISAGSRGEQHPSRVDCGRPSRAVGLRLARPVAVAPRPLPPARPLAPASRSVRTPRPQTRPPPRPTDHPCRANNRARRKDHLCDETRNRRQTRCTVRLSTHTAPEHSARRGTPDLPLATLKPLEAMCLVPVATSSPVDRATRDGSGLLPSPTPATSPWTRATPNHLPLGVRPPPSSGPRRRNAGGHMPAPRPVFRHSLLTDPTPSR